MVRLLLCKLGLHQYKKKKGIKYCRRRGCDAKKELVSFYDGNTRWIKIR